MNKVLLRAAGVMAMIVGAVVMTAGLTGSRGVSAGEQNCGSAPLPTATVVLTSLQQLPTCSPTPTVKLKTLTPTSTATGTATETPTNTPVRTNTPVPTSTPQGGNEGVSVRPPNTGTGGTAAGSVNIWLAVAGAAVAVVGGGALLAGTRRRA